MCDDQNNYNFPPFPLPAAYAYASPEASAFLGPAPPSLIPNGPGPVMQPPAWLNYPPVFDPCACDDRTVFVGMDCPPRPPPCITSVEGDGLVTVAPACDGAVVISSTGIYYNRQSSLLFTRARFELPVMLVTGDRSDGSNADVHAPPTTPIPGARLEQNATTYRAVRHVGDNGPPRAGSGLQAYTRFNARYDSGLPPVVTTTTSWTFTLPAPADFANNTTYATPADAYTNGTLGLDADPAGGNGPVVSLYITKVLYDRLAGSLRLSGPLPRDDAGLRADITIFNQLAAYGTAIAHLLASPHLAITGGWFGGATLAAFATIVAPTNASATGVVTTRYESTASGGPTATRMVWAAVRGQSMALGEGAPVIGGDTIVLQKNSVTKSGLVNVADAGTPQALRIGVAAGDSAGGNVAVTLSL